MKIIKSEEFDSYWKSCSIKGDDEVTETAVKKIITAVKNEGDEAVRRFAAMYDKSSPQKLEVSHSEIINAYNELSAKEPALLDALEFAAANISCFSKKQKEQLVNFEIEMQPNLFTGQRVIPVERAAVYVPGGRFPLFSSVLMGLIPAFSAGVEEVVLASPPAEDGLPNRVILAAAAVAANVCECVPTESGQANRLRVFAIGGAQAIAALAYGTETIPRADVIVGPGNKYVAAAKRQLYGQVGIDFIAGPSDILVIKDAQETASDRMWMNESYKARAQENVIRMSKTREPLGDRQCESEQAANLIASDMIAQAEHDPDARAKALVPDREFAELLAAALEKQMQKNPAARASLESSGLIIIYQNKDEAIRIANIIAPEHLELQTEDAEDWVPFLKNYGSLFIGALSGEVLGDYTAGINHTLPTSGSARFTGGLSVRHFLKTVTTLRCSPGSGFEKTCSAAQILAKAEGLEGHAQSASLRIINRVCL